VCNPPPDPLDGVTRCYGVICVIVEGVRPVHQIYLVIYLVRPLTMQVIRPALSGQAHEVVNLKKPVRLSRVFCDITNLSAVMRERVS